MSATSLIRPLRSNTGTLYVFKSAANDLGRTFTDDSLKFNFSKFIALDLPESKNPINLQNTMKFQLLGNRFGIDNNFSDKTVIDDFSTNLNLNSVLSNSIQNNLLNWETVILNGTNNLGNEYEQLNTTVTERIFWRWLMDIGAVRFKAPDTSQTDTQNVFVEVDETNNGYKKVVKYLGDISLINNVNKGGDSYSEVYLHIPSEHGTTPDVIFNNFVDVNYGPNYSWETGPEIVGRTSTDIPTMTVNTYSHEKTDTEDIYKTLSDFSDLSISERNISNSIDGSAEYIVNISNLDGLSINWNEEDYKKITNRNNVNSFADLNTEPEAQNFDFNAILIYYDIFNENNPSETSRNLYGILFLEDFEEVNFVGKLKSFRKFKPNELSRITGNSYSLKTNIQFLGNNGKDEIVRSFNEYSTFSMELFSDAMTTLTSSLDLLSSQKIEVLEVKEKIANLEKFYFNQSNILEFKSKLTELERTVNNSLLALENPSTILELIRKNSERITDLAKGNLGNLSYDLNPFKQGNGIKVDKGTPGRINIENTVQDYNSLNVCLNSSGNLEYSIGNGNVASTTLNNIITLGTFGNYFKNNTVFNETITNDIVINIQDTIYKFKKGQVYKIYFNNSLILNENVKIKIYTDSTNKFNLGGYKWLIGEIDYTDLVSVKPIIEIVCTDENLYKFDVNIIR